MLRLRDLSEAAQEANQYGPSVRAIELCGKEIGMYVDKHEVRGGPLDELGPVLSWATFSRERIRIKCGTPFYSGAILLEGYANQQLTDSWMVGSRRGRQSAVNHSGDPAKSQSQGEARLRFRALLRAQSRRALLQQIKHYRAIATRYDKLARNFLAALQLVAAIIPLN
jgi:hypothetical protein